MNWPSRKVRQTFIDYFVKHSKYPHVYVQSSSIVPHNDPSLAFVNAGMNQFKDVILGLGRPSNPRVTNSQKCLRINDLSLVGIDTYHHTFFEMLGNWSFSNYFKTEACSMAWDLLTNVYKLDPNRLYVTYYAGGKDLLVDNETKSIWESIGVAKNRILPFGRENFWAMGPLGPCGPSTEIHYDHRGTNSQPSEVNGDSGKVVEVWNLVFMQYNKTEFGKLERLPLSHVVDTGAGLERLTAVLNNKISNYDTDLFIPIFDTVQKLSNSAKYAGKFGPEGEMDSNYRIYADHMRAITIALSDGILPQTNHKIRKLIQRVLFITEQGFRLPMKSSGDILSFLEESVQAVSSTLSETYPEIKEMQQEISPILQNEIERFLENSKRSRVKSVDGTKNILPHSLISDFISLGRIKKSDLEQVKNNGLVDGITALRWYESMGVTEEAAEELCAALNIKFDKDGMRREMAKVKDNLKGEVAKQMLSSDENKFVKKVEAFLSSYNPEEIGGICKPSIRVTEKDPVFINWIFNESGEPIDKLCGESCWIILNKTAFIPGGKTMSSDSGSLVLSNNQRLAVTKVISLPSGWILHLVNNSAEIECKEKNQIQRFDVDNSKLFGRELSAQSMFNLQRWLFKNYGVVRFSGGFVSHDQISLEFTILKGEIESEEISNLQNTLYEYGIPLVVINKLWKQNGIYELNCATGISAEIALRHGAEVTSLISKIKELSENNINNEDLKVRDQLKNMSQELEEVLQDKNISLPYDVTLKGEVCLESVKKLANKSEEIEEITNMRNILMEKSKERIIVECFYNDVELSSLKKITKVAEEKPILILICSKDGFVQGRCSVPKGNEDGLSAEEWMSQVASELGIQNVGTPKGQDPKLVANLKRVRVSDAKAKVSRSLQKALDYAKSSSQLKVKL